MKKIDTLTQLYKLLEQRYTDRQELIDLADLSGISLTAVASTNHVSELIENILQEADQQGKVDVLLANVILQWSERADELRAALAHYSDAVDNRLNSNIAEVRPIDNSVRVGGDQIKAGDIEGDNIAIGEGAQATVHNENTTINFISSHALWLGSISIFLIAVMVVYFSALQFFREPSPGNLTNITSPSLLESITVVPQNVLPLELNSDFDIAIVEFGQIETDGNVINLKNDKSETLYKDLRDQYDKFIEKNKDIKDNFSSISISHKTSDDVADSQQEHLLPLLVSNKEERCKAASERARKIGAEMLIYGTQNSDGSADLEFYIDNDVQELLERYNVPQVIEGQITCFTHHSYPKDDFVKHGKTFFWLVLGLIEDQEGKWLEAQNYFEELELYLDNITVRDVHKAQYSVDLVKFLLGTQYISEFDTKKDNQTLRSINVDGSCSGYTQGGQIIALLDKAMEKFQDALKVEGGNYLYWPKVDMGRAWVRVGETAKSRLESERLQSAEPVGDVTFSTCVKNVLKQVDNSPENINTVLLHADTYYIDAEKIMPENQKVSFMLSRVAITWAVGQALFIMGKCDELEIVHSVENCSQAITHMNAVVQDIESILIEIEQAENKRDIVYAYRQLGLAYHRLFQMQATKDELYKQARKNFEKCTNQETDESDEILNEKITNCSQWLDYLEPIQQASE